MLSTCPETTLEWVCWRCRYKYQHSDSGYECLHFLSVLGQQFLPISRQRERAKLGGLLQEKYRKIVVDNFCSNSPWKPVIHLETSNYTCKASLLASRTAMKGCIVGTAVTDGLLSSAIWFPFYVSCKDISMMFHHCNIQTSFSMRHKIKIQGGYPKALRKMLATLFTQLFKESHKKTFIAKPTLLIWTGSLSSRIFSSPSAHCMELLPCFLYTVLVTHSLKNSPQSCHCEQVVWADPCASCLYSQS